MEVYANQKNLKEKNIFVSESLTNMRLNLLRQAEVKFGRKNVWTSEGKVFTRNNNKIVLVRPEDLYSFIIRMDQVRTLVCCLCHLFRFIGV